MQAVKEEGRGHDGLEGGLDGVPDRGGVEVLKVREEGMHGEGVIRQGFRVGLDPHENGEAVERGGDGVGIGRVFVER